MKKIIFLSVVLVWLQHCCFCQNKTMDSLKAALQNAESDTARLNIYLALGNACERNDKLLYAEQAFILADKLLLETTDRNQRDQILKQEDEEAYNVLVAYYDNKSGIAWDTVMNYIEKRLRNFEQTGNKKRTAETLRVISGIYYYRHDTAGYIKNGQKSLALFNEIKDSANIVAGYINFHRYYLSAGNFVKAFESLQSALTISRNLNYQAGIASGLRLLGDLYRDNGENAQALKNYQEALSIAAESKDTINMYAVMAALGGFYYNQHDTGKAFEYYNRLLELYPKKRSREFDPAIVYKWIGIVYRDNDNYNNALLNFEKSLFLFESTGDPDKAKGVLDEMGSVYNKQENFKQAIEYHSRALKIADSLEWEEGQARSYYLLALDYYTLKDYKTAEKYNGQALAVLRERPEVKPLADAELLASLIDSVMGNGMRAYQHYKEYISLNNKLKGEEIRAEAQKEKFQSELDKQKAAQEKKDAEARRIKNQQYFIIAALGIIALAVIIIALIQNRNNKQKQKANALLQQQKEKVESTLTELKSTQAQLIQSEKMASLGELTAGIAHEIQNPLNFVNNFSEVNTELIDELQGERLKVNGERNEEIEDEILNDIKQNTEKILSHGKRADAIVKGMLQHSRASTGKKEPTDINALADEYLRLSYHGMRAKDKTFNAEIKTEFDESIGKINVVPQDIGRVLLNLLNNAFYAVNEKKQKSGGTFDPIITVSTKKGNGNLILKVVDNGPGIPQKVLDKIFQPFFTTKPTGQGTGLGLSLAYDIIKAHGGEINVESQEWDGSEFIISLPIDRASKRDH